LSLGIEFAGEARHVARLLGAETLIGKRLSKRRVQRAFEAADAVHVSAHGFYSSERPELSGILLQPLVEYEKTLLAWDKETVELTQEDILTLAYDERARRAILTTADVERLHLSARLVSLSACSTGLIATGPGDDPAGLTAAFLSAGVRNILASLWKVDPDATEEFMMAFYRALQVDAVGWRRLPRALQVAARDVMTRRRHPYYWAPFVLIGGLVAPNAEVVQ
jgi:CHAT domain-containing protein